MGEANPQVTMVDRLAAQAAQTAMLTQQLTQAIGEAFAWKRRALQAEAEQAMARMSDAPAEETTAAT